MDIGHKDASNGAQLVTAGSCELPSDRLVAVLPIYFVFPNDNAQLPIKCSSPLVPYTPQKIKVSTRNILPSLSSRPEKSSTKYGSSHFKAPKPVAAGNSRKLRSSTRRCSSERNCEFCSISTKNRRSSARREFLPQDTRRRSTERKHGLPSTSAKNRRSPARRESLRQKIRRLSTEPLPSTSAKNRRSFARHESLPQEVRRHASTLYKQNDSPPYDRRLLNWKWKI